MTERFESNQWNRFLEDLATSPPDRAYRHHPDRSRLAEYVSAGSPDTPDVEQLAQVPDGDLQAWLEGRSGWSASAVSMHALTCRICRRRIELIREEQLAPTEEASTSPWWQQIQDTVGTVGSILTAPRLRRRVATIGVIGIIFLSLVLSLLPGSPPSSDNSPPLPVERHGPDGGSIG